jgi:hypothetical protein
MLQLAKNFLFSKESMYDRDFNLDTDFVCGAPLGLRMGLVDIPPTFYPQWMQDCMSNTVADVMKWIESESYMNCYYSVTGIAFAIDGIVIYMPLEDETMSRMSRSTTYISSCIASIASQSFRAHALKMETLFPGTAQEFHSMFDRPTIVAVRFFRLDSEDPIGDAYNYLQYLASQDEQEDVEQNEDEQNEDEQNEVEQNEDEQNEVEQNEDEQNEVEQNEVEQNEDEQNEDEQNENEDDMTSVEPIWPLSFLFHTNDDDNEEPIVDPPKLIWHVIKKDFEGTFKTFTTQFITAAICSPIWQPSSSSRQNDEGGEIEVNLIGKQPILE